MIRPDLVPALLLASPIALVGLDADLVVALANPAVCHLLDIDPREASEQLLGRSFNDFVHPEDRDLLRAEWAKVQANPREEGSGRIRARAADGGVQLVEFQMRPAWFTDDRMELAAVSLRPGGPAGVAATTVVTIEPMADVVISTMDQAAAVLDAGGTIRSASAKLRELLDEPELRGRELISFLHPDDHRVFVDMAFGVDEPDARKARMAELRVVLAGGRLVTLNASVGRREHDRSGEFVIAFAEKDNASEKPSSGSDVLSAPMRQMLVRTVGMLSQQTGDDLPEAINASFSALSRLAGADAAALLMPGREPVIWADRRAGGALTFDGDRALRSQRRFQDEDTMIDDRDLLPVGELRELLSAIGARSLLGVPVRVGSDTGAFLLLRPERPATWTRSAADAAAIIGRAAAAALARAEPPVAQDEGARRWRALVERSSDVLMLVDHEAKVIYASPAIGDILGLEADDVVGRQVFEVITPDAASGLADGVNEAAIYQAMHVDGTLRYLDAVATNLLDEPDVNALVISARDVTDRLRAERARQEAEERYRSVVEHVGVVVWNAGTDRRWTQLGPMWSGLTGRPSEHALGDLMTDALHQDDRPRLQQALAELAGGRVQESILDARLKGTPVRWVNLKARLARDEEGMVSGYVGTIADITERQLAAEAREHDATHDALTKLPNRSFLRRHLSEAVERARSVGNEELAVLVVDLDGLKLVNDALGHETGDQVLLEIAGRLAGSATPGTLIARFGSDEFVAVVESAWTDQELTTFAQSVVSVVGEPIDAGGHPVIVSACIGMGRFGRDGADATALLRAADVAAQWAKRGGRDQVCFHDASMRPRSTTRLTLEADLRRAIDHGQFVLHYQPIYDARTGGLRAGEALVRWNHPERGMILPGEFIRVAEESGLIVPLGEWVLTEALAQRSRWMVNGEVPSDYRTFVNLSVRQLMSPGFADRIVRLFHQHSVDPSHVCLELTESTFVEDTDRIGILLRNLGRLGCTIALDDFGTGYSTFTVLRDLPFTMVKIDRSLVDGLGRSDRGNAVVQTVLASAKELGIETVAEGIERPEQLAVLRSQGCDFVQGYLLGRPIEVGTTREVQRVDLDLLSKTPIVLGAG